MYIGIYELNLAKVLSDTGLAWQPDFKKTKVKLELLTEIDMSLMTEKSITGGMDNAVHWYAKGNNKYMKDYGITITWLLGCT